MARIFLIGFTLAVLLALGSLLPTPAAAQDDRQLADLVAEVLAANPELAGDQARRQAAEEQVRQAGELADPMLMLQLQNLPLRNPLSFNRDPASAKVIGISQAVPFFGKRELQRRAARGEAEAAELAVAERALELGGMVREAWYRLLFLDQSLAIIARNIELIDDLNTQSTIAYESGRGQLQDLLQTRIEQGKMEEMRITLAQQRRDLEVALNSLAARPGSTPINPADPLTLTPLELTADDLAALAAGRPLLRQLAVREEKGATLQRLAQREFYPDFTFSLEYMQRESAMGDPGYDMYTAAVSFNLPLGRGRRHAGVAEAAAEVRRLQAEQAGARNQIQREIGEALNRLSGERQRAQLYEEEIIPQARFAAEAALSAYRSGTAGFMNLLAARMALFNFQREHLAALAGHQIQLARLETTVGQTLLAPEAELNAAPLAQPIN